MIATTHNRRLILVLAIGLLPAIAAGQEDVALAEGDRDHWAFRPVRRPLVPAVRRGDWPRGVIDRFVLARLERVGLSAAPEADRATLLRRLSFDLTGLPPAPAELQAFVDDDAPGACERLVDRLLTSTAYGQRWGQHWLDLARFAETDGFEHDKVRSDAWKYRDWVIAALNDNIPYDRFIQLQVAGDELDDPEQAVATMFCLSGPDMPDVNDQVERRHLMLNEMTSTVGSVFLGLQMGCAECHDHKYDPVSQGDYYRLRAVFEPAVPGLKRDVPWPRLKRQGEAIAARLWIRGDHRRPGPPVEAAFPRIASRSDSGDRPSPDASSRLELARWLVRADNPLTARVMVNRVWKHHFGRGLFDTPSDVGLLNAEPSHPELLDWLAEDFQSHGWNLKRLHRQIVCSAAYRQASRASDADPDWNRRLQSDPEIALISRGSRRRLDGESLRDAMLAVAGLLTDERGGPGVMPPLPEELTGTLLRGQWKTSPRAADHDRRSIYLFARRNLRYPLFEVFDRPDANASCAARNRSTTPPQSLLLLNSALSLRVARHLAGQVMNETQDQRQRIERIYVRVFARGPSDDESRRLRQFVADEGARLRQENRPADQLALPMGAAGDDPCADAALVELCLALLNAGEMVYVD